ncbi:MAG: hypothetical protein ACXVA0_24040 [Mucilaginibacter sp.]
MRKASEREKLNAQNKYTRLTMTSEYGIETPANKIATAKAILCLAIRLSGEVESGRITSEVYKHSVTVHTGGQGLILPAYTEGNDQDLKTGISNIVFVALYASALTLDETLLEMFGAIKDDKNSAQKGIRVMINQVRNAFAHNPWRPKWVIHKPYRASYTIELEDKSKFTFDATNLDGDGVKPEHVGGLEFWMRLVQHCEKLVS